MVYVDRQFTKVNLGRRDSRDGAVVRALQSSLTNATARVRFRPGARFSKAPESFRARKAIFRSSVSKNGEVYSPETSCMKETSLHL